MSDELKVARDWFTRNSPNLHRILGATTELIEKLQPAAAAADKTIGQLVNDDEVTVRALLDGAGIAAIAGAHGVSVDLIMEGLGQVLGIVALVGAIS